MSKVYDIAFRMGVLFNVVLFTLLNVINYKWAESEYLQRQIERERGAPSFGCCESIGSWGFPFDWTVKYSIIEGMGTILNIIIIAACGFAFGFLFKFFFRESHNNTLN